MRWLGGLRVRRQLACLLLGLVFAGGCGKKLLVDQDGNMFTADVNNNWWKWNGSGWNNLNTTTTP